MLAARLQFVALQQVLRHVPNKLVHVLLLMMLLELDYVLRAPCVSQSIVMHLVALHQMLHLVHLLPYVHRDTLECP